MRPVPFSEFQTRLRNVRSKFDLLRIFLPDHHFSDDALRSLLTSPSPHVDTLARPDDVNHLAPLTLPTVDGEQDAEVTATPQDSNGPGAGTGALKNGRVSSASGVGLEKPPAQPAMPGPPGSAPLSDTVLTRTGKSGSAPHSDTVLTRTGKSGSAPHSDTVLTRTGKSGSAPHSDTVLTRTGKSLEDVLGRDDSGGVSADLVPAKGDSMVKSPGVQADVLLNGRTAVNSGSAGKKSRQKDATQDHSVTQPGLKKRAELTNEDADYDDDDDDDDAVDEEDYLDGEVEYYNDQSNTDALLEGERHFVNVSPPTPPSPQQFLSPSYLCLSVCLSVCLSLSASVPMSLCPTLAVFLVLSKCMLYCLRAYVRCMSVQEPVCTCLRVNMCVNVHADVNTSRQESCHVP